MLFSTRMRANVFALCLTAAFSLHAARPVSLDHHEFEASLHAPYTGTKSAEREFTLYFSYMDARDDPGQTCRPRARR